MRVTAAVISWNAGAQLDEALSSLAAQTGVDLDVVVFDNASADGSADRAAAHPGVAVVRNPVNLGYAGAANQAVARARDAGADALCVCNADIRLAPDYLAQATAALVAHPGCASVQGKLWRTVPGPGGARIIDTTGHQAFVTRLFRNRGEGCVDDGRFDQPGEVFGVSGAVGLYRVAALADVEVDGEVFDNDLFAFWEDVDLDWRLQLAGWSAWYTPAATGWHERGGAGPRRSALVERLNWVNRLFVVIKNDDLGALARAAPGVGFTTLLKTVELAVTVPRAALAGLRDLQRVPSAWRKRRVIQERARVPASAVVARWFEPFDYRGWWRTWRRRMRAEAAAGR